MYICICIYVYTYRICSIYSPYIEDLIIFLALYIVLTSEGILGAVSSGGLKLSALPCFRDFGPVQVSALSCLRDDCFCWASLDPLSLLKRCFIATPGTALDLSDPPWGVYSLVRRLVRAILRFS